MKLHILLFFAFSYTLLAASDTSPDAIVENYLTASHGQQRALDGASMEVDIQASVPYLQKQGRLHALRHISSLGRITYDALRFDGDNTVKHQVIARYLAAEAQSQSDEAPSLAVTPANYKFKYEGERQSGGQNVYVFHVTPRHKKVGLFKGEVWVDPNTYLRVRESGRLVKNPSIFIKKVEFVREYEIQDGISVPRQMHSVVYTRLVGPAELNIEFGDVSFPRGSNQASLMDMGGE